MTGWRIDRLGHLGDGIAEGPVYAARTLPGEVVTGRLDGERLEDIRIKEPSDQRVRPPCRHYKGCGGCQLQHASDAFVADWKAGIVIAALAAHGIRASVGSVHTSPAHSRRRATLSARRTKKGALVGFHGRASDVIVDVPECRLLRPAVLAGVAVVQDLAVMGGSRKGELSVNLTESDAGLDVTVAGGKPLDGPFAATLAQFAGQKGLARLTWNGETIAQTQPPAQVFGRARVVPPPGAFLQATREGEAALVEAVLDAIGPANRVLDLFSGCGTFTLPVAEQSEVHAVEADAAMLRALDAGWRHAEGLKLVTTEARDLFRSPVAADEMRRFDAAILDPPRAGAEAQTGELIKAGIARIAYVSCSPTSFARDAADLVAAGYTMTPIRVVDQFRWSSHVELVAGFTR